MVGITETVLDSCMYIEIQQNTVILLLLYYSSTTYLTFAAILI